MFKSVNPGAKRTFAMAALAMLGLLLLMAPSASAGRVGGRSEQPVTIQAGQDRTFYLNFTKGTCVVSAGGARVRIQVFDSNGSLVADNEGIRPGVLWTAPSQMQYRVVFKYNPDPTASNFTGTLRFTMKTN